SASWAELDCFGGPAVQLDHHVSNLVADAAVPVRSEPHRPLLRCDEGRGTKSGGTHTLPAPRQTARWRSSRAAPSTPGACAPGASYDRPRPGSADLSLRSRAGDD